MSAPAASRSICSALSPTEGRETVCTGARRSQYGPAVIATSTKESENSSKPSGVRYCDWPLKLRAMTILRNRSGAIVRPRIMWTSARGASSSGAS